MKFFVLFIGLHGILLTSAEDNSSEMENSDFTDFAESDLNFTLGFTEDTLGNTQSVPLMQYQDISNLRIYKGPLPKFPGTTASPWIALHSPVRMYIPIRNAGEVSAESTDCVQCPRNLIVYLAPRQRYILTPVPTISICSSFAQQSGRVHVAVVSGPRPAARLYAGRHQVELMVWKADGPVHTCKYTIIVKRRRQASTIPNRLSCSQPQHPSDGILLCDDNGKNHYPHDSVCQIFCPSNYLVENTSTNSSTIICKNGHWTPRKQISCIAEFCPDLPRIGEHNFWNCSVEDSTKAFRNGTRCKVSCAPGYVIPSSQSEQDIAICKPPTWDYMEAIPVCKKAHLPKLQFCHNRHLYVRPGQFIKIASIVLPKGFNHAGEPLSSTCSLQGKSLPKGKHENICEVLDPEFKTRQTCTYQINIEETDGPRAHPRDCKNRTTFISGTDAIYIKPVRFFTKVGQPIRTKVLQGKCKPKGYIGIGNHFVVCKATDPHTKLTATCSYWLNIQKRTCPPMKPIQNGKIICSSREVGSVCHYECDPGYSFAGNHSSRATKLCKSNRKWHPFFNPVCKIETPTILEGCNDLDVQMNSTENFTVPLPRFVTSMNETLNVSCLPPYINTAGLHQIFCQTEGDDFNASCHFNVSILLKDEVRTDISDMLPKDDIPKFIEGCNNIEINMSTPVYYKVPTPQYLTSFNETLNVSCVPFLLTSIGQHQIVCSSNNDDFNVSCQFNVSIQMDEGLNPLLFLEEDSTFELISGCNNITINASLPINFTVPQPEYQSPSNVTILGSCIPSLINAAGNHTVNCTVDNEAFNSSCQINVIIVEQEETTDLEASVKDPLFQLISGCISFIVNASNSQLPVNVTVPQPEYQSSSNDTILGSCVPSIIDAPGSHLINCTADNEAFSSSCQFNITVAVKDEVTNIPSAKIESCKPLIPPAHGVVECTSENSEICQVSCDPGYGFPEDDFLIFVCSGEPKLWKSQNSYSNDTVPECLPQLEGSAVQVWMSFEAIASNCGEELQESIKNLINGMCEEGTNCSSISIDCTLDEESDMMLMTVNWTVQADFIDEEHYDDEEIPEAEIRLEAVMENARKFLASENTPQGIELYRDSFRKGFITLVCPDEFVPNMLMSKCVLQRE